MIEGPVRRSEQKDIHRPQIKLSSSLFPFSIGLFQKYPHPLPLYAVLEILMGWGSMALGGQWVFLHVHVTISLIV